MTDIVDHDDGDMIMTTAAGCFLLWEGVIQPFWNGVQSTGVTHGSLKKHYSLLRTKLEYLRDGSHHEQFPAAEKPNSSYRYYFNPLNFQIMTERGEIKSAKRSFASKYLLFSVLKPSFASRF